jgi:hypothetical protein
MIHDWLMPPDWCLFWLGFAAVCCLYAIIARHF